MPKKKVIKRHSKTATPKPVEVEPIISFETTEFAHHSKNELWYIGIGLILLVGVLLTLRLGNYLLTAVVLAAGLAIFRIARERPGSHKVTLTPAGVEREGKTLGFHEFKAFWASENSGQLTVYLERVNLMPIVHFVVPDELAESVLTVLALELPFHYHKTEPFTDRINRLLRI